MKSVLLFLAVIAGLAASDFDGVLYMTIDEDLKDNIVYLQKDDGHKTPLGANFGFKNCGDPKTDLVNVKSISVKPDPVQLPGDLNIAFEVEFNQAITGSVQATSIIQTFSGGKWVTIPCIASIGSCHYADVCSLLGTIKKCPQPFIDHKVPCKCPIARGNYIFPLSKISIGTDLVPTGYYHANANFTLGSKRVACVDLHISFTN